MRTRLSSTCPAAMMMTKRLAKCLLASAKTASIQMKMKMTSDDIDLDEEFDLGGDIDLDDNNELGEPDADDIEPEGDDK